MTAVNRTRKLYMIESAQISTGSALLRAHGHLLLGLIRQDPLLN